MQLVAVDTDNQANAAAVEKMMSSKFPLNAVLCELAVEAHLLGLPLQVGWIPREQNVEADALSNLVFAGFRPELRIQADLTDLSWHVLPKLFKFGEDLFREVADAKEQRKRMQPEAEPVRARKRRPDEKLKMTDPW